MKIASQVTNGYDSKSFHDSWSLGECVDFFSSTGDLKAAFYTTDGPSSYSSQRGQCK
jgi:hypothetical protein